MVNRQKYFDLFFIYAHNEELERIKKQIEKQQKQAIADSVNSSAGKERIEEMIAYLKSQSLCKNTVL